MDAFEIGVLAVVAAAVLACCLAARAAGRARRGGPANRAGSRRGAARVPSDAEDLRDMLAVTNARRRARGLPERSVADAMREFGGD